MKVINMYQPLGRGVKEDLNQELGKVEIHDLRLRLALRVPWQDQVTRVVKLADLKPGEQIALLVPAHNVYAALAALCVHQETGRYPILVRLGFHPERVVELINLENEGEQDERGNEA